METTVFCFTVLTIFMTTLATKVGFSSSLLLVCTGNNVSCYLVVTFVKNLSIFFFNLYKFTHGTCKQTKKHLTGMKMLREYLGTKENIKFCILSSNF